MPRLDRNEIRELRDLRAGVDAVAAAAQKTAQLAGQVTANLQASASQLSSAELQSLLQKQQQLLQTLTIVRKALEDVEKATIRKIGG